MFPLLSVTVQVTIVVPIKNVVGALLVTLATGQLSEAIGEPKFTLKATHPLLAVSVKSDGAMIAGLIASLTVTLCVVVAWLPLASVTVHVTVVVPTGNIAGALLVALATEQLSAVVIPKLIFEAPQAKLDGTVISAATIVGKVVSTTFTV